jgi:integrase
VIRHARPSMRPFLVLLWETGMRRDEVRRLRWSWINEGFIVIPKGRQHSKNGEGRTIPLSSAALLALEMQPRLPACDYVFANAEGDGPWSKSHCGKWWRDARDKAGIQGPAGQSVWTHTLRHSAATELCTKYQVDVKTLQDMFGWKDPNIIDLYVNIAARERHAIKPNLDERSSGLIAQLHTYPNHRRGPARKEAAALAADKGKAVK